MCREMVWSGGGAVLNPKSIWIFGHIDLHKHRLLRNEWMFLGSHSDKWFVDPNPEKIKNKTVIRKINKIKVIISIIMFLIN